MTTLKDIAKRAGVSVMTVSRVINGQTSKVSKETIEKINALIKEYNYIPNSAARALSGRSSKIIALCTDWKDYDFLESPYHSKIASIIGHNISKNGYYLMLCGLTSIEKIVADLKTWNVAGAIFLGIAEDNIAKLNQKLKIPLVCIDCYFKDKNISTVGTNDYKGGYLAGRYLANAGHRNIGFSSYNLENNTLLAERFKGFTDALTESGISFNYKHLYTGDVSYEGGLLIGKKIADDKDVTAVFATGDIMAVGIMEGARLNGINVPKDLSIIGFDDLPLCLYVTPKLTTIHQQVLQKAEISTNLLFDLIQHKSCEVKNIVLDVEIMERQSVIQI